MDLDSENVAKAAIVSAEFACRNKGKVLPAEMESGCALQAQDAYLPMTPKPVPPALQKPASVVSAAELAKGLARRVPSV